MSTTSLPGPTPSPAPLAGQTLVVTGTLPTLTRPDAQCLIKAAGGTVSQRVTKDTTAVVVGNDPGSRAQVARALGVPVIDEAELRRRAGV